MSKPTVHSVQYQKNIRFEHSKLADEFKVKYSNIHVSCQQFKVRIENFTCVIHACTFIVKLHALTV